MDLKECFRMLQLPESSSNDEISKSYKILAHKYHPDKNRDKVEWATKMMSNLNLSYTTIMSSRFSDSSKEERLEENARPAGSEAVKTKKGKKVWGDDVKDYFDRETLIDKFADLKEKTKDALYKYFQYGLFNFARRENPINQSIFNEIVTTLKKSYHAIRRMLNYTDDLELHEHFDSFTNMILGFYKAAECLNVLDSYTNVVDVEAYRLYKKGDDALHFSHREIFFDRHNRGSFKKDVAVSYLLKSSADFKETMRIYPNSTWIVETKIKLDYVSTLKKYIDLFFNE